MVVICQKCGGLQADPGELYMGVQCFCSPTHADVVELVEAISSVQDWSGTRVGDILEKFEKYGY